MPTISHTNRQFTTYRILDATVGYADMTTPFNWGADTAGHDVKLFGATTGHYLLWDESEDDLILAGAASIFSVDSIVDTSSAITGSIHTDGGLGIAKAIWVGTTSRLVGAVTCDDAVSIDDITDSSSIVTGSLHTDGGVGIALALFVGTTGNFAGQLNADATTASTTTATGALVCDGGLGVAGAVYVGGLVSSAGGFVSTAQTLTPDADRTYIAYQIGTRAAAKDITMATDVNQNLDPIQVNLNIIGTAPTSSTVNLSYMNITHALADMTGLRLKCSDWTISVAKNIKDAYVYQGEIIFSTNAVAVSGEACVMGLVLNAGTVGVTGGVRGLKISMGGSGMPATTSAGLSIDAATAATLGHAIYIETQGGTVITTGIHMANAGTFTNAIYVAGTIANFLNLSTAGNSGFVTTGGTDCNTSGATAPEYTLKIINPAGAAGYIRVWGAA